MNPKMYPEYPTHKKWPNFILTGSLAEIHVFNIGKVLCALLRWSYMQPILEQSQTKNPTISPRNQNPNQKPHYCPST